MQCPPHIPDVGCFQGPTPSPRLSFEFLEKVAAEIIQEVPGIVSVTYNIAPKPPSTIEAV